MARLALEINGRQQTVDADPEMPLLWVLRDLLNMTGTKYGCGIGLCGACTVHIDGAAARSCQTSLATAASKQSHHRRSCRKRSTPGPASLDL
jgi:isoquinoline 1-oxidoreductase alpha subunit